MTMETIQGQEYAVSEDVPTIDGDYIRNILVLGLESKNAWNASTTGAGDPNGPRRKFGKIVNASEELIKFNNKPAFVLHKPLPRRDEDLLGTFDGARSSDKGARMDLLCRKMDGTEAYHPHIIALRDDITNKRPFGGFSPRFDFTIDPMTGETQTVIGVESIDLVTQPASVKSAVEGDSEPEGYATKEEHLALEARVKACECYMAASKTAGSEETQQRSDPPPAAKKIVTTAKSFKEFVRQH